MWMKTYIKMYADKCWIAWSLIVFDIFLLGVRALFGHIKLRPVADWPQLYIPRLATESAAGRMKSVCLLGWLAATGPTTIHF